MNVASNSITLVCEYSQGFPRQGCRMTVGFSKTEMLRRSDLSFEISDSKARVIYNRPNTQSAYCPFVGFSVISSDLE